MLRKTVLAAVTGVLAVGTAGLAQAASGLDIVQGTPVVIPPASGNFAGAMAATAQCPAGEVLTGGGANVTAGNSYLQNYQLVSSVPISGERWWAFATNMDPNASGKVTAYVVCAKSNDLTVLSTP